MSRDFRCPPDHKHASNKTCYASHGCRCEECVVAYRVWQRDIYRRKAYGTYTPRLVPATGTRRRVEALQCMGWSLRALAPHLGMDFRNLRTTIACERTTREVAARVARVYDELWDQPPGTQRGNAVLQTVIRARRLGFAPPLAWDDDTIDIPDAEPQIDPPVEGDRLDATIVDAAVAGEQPKMSPREREAAIRRLNALNWSAARIGRWIGCNKKTVDRVRKRLQLPVPDNQTIREAA